jgi:hypothetical protein
MTLEEAKEAIEVHLSESILNPKIYVDVVEYNSKVCYVINDGAGLGEQIARFPITGNETVLDVISQIQGIPAISTKDRIWVARPAPVCSDCDQMLPVDWVGITQRGATLTNYQILPGDRIYIDSDRMVAFSNFVEKFTAPFQQMFGFTIFGNATVRTLQQGRNATGGFGSGIGGGGF